MKTPGPEYMRNFPIITLHQPWASWVSVGWKTGETRTSPRLLKMLEGRYFFVHAGKAWDHMAVTAASRWLHEDKQVQTFDEFTGVRGQVLCMALGGKMRPMQMEDEPRALISSMWIQEPGMRKDGYYELEPTTRQRWFLPIERVDPLDKPIPARGQQGIWYLR